MVNPVPVKTVKIRVEYKGYYLDKITRYYAPGNGKPLHHCEVVILGQCLRTFPRIGEARKWVDTITREVE